MRKLATHLYTANRELKGLLLSAPMGSELTELKQRGKKLALLTQSDWDALLTYTNGTGTVTFFQRGEDTWIILNAAVDPAKDYVVVYPYGQPTTTEKPARKVAVKATKPKAEPLEGVGKPTLHLNHENRQVVDWEPYKEILRKLPVEWRKVAAPVLECVRPRRYGSTQSELTKLIPEFDYLPETTQVALLNSLVANSDGQYQLVCNIPSRHPDTFALLHSEFLTMDHLSELLKPVNAQEEPMPEWKQALAQLKVNTTEPAPTQDPVVVEQPVALEAPSVVTTVKRAPRKTVVKPTVNADSRKDLVARVRVVQTAIAILNKELDRLVKDLLA